MKKTELIERVAKRTGASRATTRKVLNATLDEILACLVRGEKVTLTGFGTFDRVWSPPRRARHPRTGRLIELHPRYHVRFAASAPLARRLKALIPRFDGNVAHQKARRTARTLASDIRLYHGSLVEAARREGKPGKQLAELLEEARARYRDRVPAPIRRERDYLEEEIAALLGKREPPDQP